MKVKLLDKISTHNDELISYVFLIKDLPRFVLQELVRHRQASYSVKSSRYTLAKEFRNEIPFIVNDNGKLIATKKNIQRASKYIRLSSDERLYLHQLIQLDQLLMAITRYNLKSDEAKYLLPETWLCDLVWTIDKDSLNHFLELRSSSSAHKDIQELARLVKEAI